MPFDVVTNNLGLLTSGLLLTIFISVVSIVSGLVLGVGVAAARLSRSAPLRFVASVYVEIIRNTPVLVQMLLLYLGLPEFGIRLEPLVAVLIALAVNNGAY